MAKKQFFLEGMIFSELTVLKEIEPYIIISTGGSERRYLCQCSCGKQAEVKMKNLRGGKTRSCGHLRGGSRYRNIPKVK